MAIAVFALQMSNELLNIVHIIIKVKLAVCQRHQASVFPIGDVNLVIFQHGLHGVAQQGGVVA